MSIRLFHKGARVVWPTSRQGRSHAWCVLHRTAVPWGDIFRPALALVGIAAEPASDGVRFAGGRIDWTRGALWTTIRVELPPCSVKKAALLASGLLKAARYAKTKENVHGKRE